MLSDFVVLFSPSITELLATMKLYDILDTHILPVDHLVFLKA